MREGPLLPASRGRGGELSPRAGPAGGAGDPIRIGVSSCLLGEPVRYNGGHKRDPFLVQTLGPFVSWVPVCPEVELGLGTPRDTIRLERRGDAVRLIMPSQERDLTDAMRAFAQRRVRELEALKLSGYVLKKDSPSCGMDLSLIHI